MLCTYSCSYSSGCDPTALHVCEQVGATLWLWPAGAAASHAYARTLAASQQQLRLSDVAPARRWILPPTAGGDGAAPPHDDGRPTQRLYKVCACDERPRHVACAILMVERDARTAPLDTTGVEMRASHAHNSCSGTAARFLQMLEHNDIGRLILGQISVRRLWLLRRVSRRIHNLCVASLASMPRPVVVGGGEQTDATSRSVIESLDLSTMRWSAYPPLSAPRRSAGICSVSGGRLVVAGGYRTKRPSTNVMDLSAEVFDPEMNRWFQLPPLERARVSCRLVWCASSGQVLALGMRGFAGSSLVLGVGLID
jgi:hypothetical protein